MTFPIVQGRSTSREEVDTTSHVVDLPPGIKYGDILIAMLATNTPSTISWPAGWNEIFDKVNTIPFIDGPQVSIAYRRAESYMASVTVSTVGTHPSTSLSYRISGGEHPDIQAPEVSTGHPSDESSTMNPDSLTPTGGAKDYLWLALGGAKLYSAVAYPASYSSGITIRNVDPPFGSAVAGAERQLNAVSEDPGVFTLARAAFNYGMTVVVHPATVVDDVIFFNMNF